MTPLGEGLVTRSATSRHAYLPVNGDNPTTGSGPARSREPGRRAWVGLLPSAENRPAHDPPGRERSCTASVCHSRARLLPSEPIADHEP